MKTINIAPWFVLLAGSLYANSAGLENDINDAFTMASGGAVAARAANAATNWYNPAGISRLKGNHANFTLSRETIEYEHHSASTGAKAESSDYFMIPAMYLTSNYDYRWSWGVGLQSPYGLSFEWNDPATKYVVTKSEFKSLYLTPSVSYAFDDKFSLALGLNLSRSTGELKRNLNLTALNTVLNGNVPSISADAQSQLDGEDTGLGFNIGLMYGINDKGNLGLVYRSKNSVKLDGDLNITGLNGTAAAVFGGSSYSTGTVLEFDLPPSLTLGYAHKTTKKLTMELDVEYVQWSDLDDFNVRYKSESNATRLLVLNTDNPSRKDWNNTFNVACGMEYAFSNRYSILAGTRFRPSPVPDETADPLIPVNDLWNVDLGYSINFTNSRLDFVVAHAFSKTRNIDNNVGASSLSSVDGKYNLVAQVLGVSYNLRF